MSELKNDLARFMGRKREAISSYVDEQSEVEPESGEVLIMMAGKEDQVEWSEICNDPEVLRQAANHLFKLAKQAGVSWH